MSHLGGLVLNFKENLNLKLKRQPQRLLPQDSACRSDEVHPSPGAAPPNSDIRAFYLNHVRSKKSVDVSARAFVPAPLISISPFVPITLVRLLMRSKKDSALGVKYEGGDKITNMEGAMHAFVTPIIGRCEMMGDYKYEHGHGVEKFGSGLDSRTQAKVTLTRSIALSGSIQPDFEDTKIMLAVSKLDASAVIGKNLLHGRNDSDTPWENCTAQDKHDATKRAAYDARLRAHMVFHLTESRRLPARKDVMDPMSVKEATSFLESVINSKKDVEWQLEDQFMKTSNNHVVSLELLYNTAVQQVINEFSALEAMFPQGYVYTYDPAVIFAKEIGSPILNRLFLAAVKSVSNHNLLANMKVFAINDFADKNLVPLAKSALAAQAMFGGLQSANKAGHTVKCMGKAQVFNGVFNGTRGFYGGEERGAMLVVHNNSDGFGQNIETEGMTGSLDGTIGASSSAAASLERGRPDLLDFLY